MYQEPNVLHDDSRLVQVDIWAAGTAMPTWGALPFPQPSIQETHSLLSRECCWYCGTKNDAQSIRCDGCNATTWDRCG